MVEPVTTIGALAAAALGIAGEAILKGAVGEAVKDSYKALKEKIAAWGTSDVEALEKTPTSTARQAVVAEIVDARPGHETVAVRTLAEQLLTVLRSADSTGIEVGRLEALEVRLRKIRAHYGGTGVRMGDVRVHGTFSAEDIEVGKQGKS